MIVSTEPKIELLNCDCMEYMAGLPDKAFDLAIVDPPYGINAAAMQMGNNAPSRNGKASVAVKLRNKGIDHKWDYAAPQESYFKELKRVSINQIIWGGNYFPLPPTRGIIAWDKCQPWENFSQFELAWTSFDRVARLFKWSNTGGNPDKMDKIHPTQKPVALYSWLLHNYATPGIRILDTHLGSGSSAIAAHKAGFEFVGMELDTDYYNAAIKRFKEQTAQLRLL